MLLKKTQLSFIQSITVHTCYSVGMLSVKSASRYQSSSSMYIRGMIPQNWPSQFRLHGLVINKKHLCIYAFYIKISCIELNVKTAITSHSVSYIQ